MSFDTEKFILEIEFRRAIWDSSCSDYSNRDVRKRQWEEIVDLFGDEGLSEEEKKDLGMSLQRKWKNLRSCFTREMRRLKTAKSGSAASRKSPYRFYNQLLFLKRITADTSTESSRLEEDNTTDQTILSPYLNDTIGNRKRKYKRSDESTNKELINTLQRSIDARRKREATLQEDEDRMFLLSLLSSFRKIPKHRKAPAKIQLINVIETARYSDNFSDFHSQPSTSWNNHETQDYNQSGYHIRRLPSRQPVNLESPQSQLSTETTSSENSDYFELF